MEKKLSLYLKISFIFDSIMIFYELFPNLVTMFIMMIYVVWSVIYLQKVIGIFFAVVFTSVSMIPLSFISVLGTSTENMPIAWFHILVILTMFYILKKGKINKWYLIFTIMFFLYGIGNSVLQKDVSDGIKQVLMIVLFFFSFFIGEYGRKKTNQKISFYFYRLYILTTLACAVHVILQYIMINYFGIIIGKYEEYLNRKAYGGLMADYSFATTYLATGVMAILLEYFEYRRIDLKKFLQLVSVLIIGLLRVTARTGVYALAITVIIYFCVHLKHLHIRQLLFILVAVLFVPMVIDVLSSNRGTQNLLDGSGRVRDYVVALRAASGQIILGLGFGLNNLNAKTGTLVPHNFFIQYIVQSGIVGMLLISMPFLYYLKRIINKVDSSIWLFVLIFISAMAIPDIVCSRFLYAVVVMNYLSLKNLIEEVSYG